MLVFVSFFLSLLSTVYFKRGFLPVTVTTKIITFFQGIPINPYLPLLLGGGHTQCISTYQLEIFLGTPKRHDQLHVSLGVYPMILWGYSIILDTPRGFHVFGETISRPHQNEGR